MRTATRPRSPPPPSSNGPGAQQAAQQIAGRFNAAAPAAGSAVPVGHVLVTPGENYALPGRQAFVTCRHGVELVVARRLGPRCEGGRGAVRQLSR
ncbi:hypothetical protein ACWEP4_13695 [Streptomyces sp. NPDC004227]